MIRRFDPIEQRVVGCLVEKELSTPDVYPLTLNALVAACNQTSNREPVSRLSAADVEAALLRLMADLLVWRDRGARALRWKHSLDEKLGLKEPAAKSVLAELLLRGAQTPGELRARTPRMHQFVELGEVEETLRALAARGLVEELPRQPGQKERRWRHLLGSGAVPEAPGTTRARVDAVEDDATVHQPALPSAVPAATVPPTVLPSAGSPRFDRVPQTPPPVADTPRSKTAGAAPMDAAIAARLTALERRVEELAAIVARLSGEKGTGD
ncbi:MAG TPA: YceH family protein [Thermoanaerobaculia bacterium]|nr:YceH family protein [Thermoanaerobaculia bacterium]